MYKIGLIGAQSFHAQKFAGLINQDKVIDASITHIWPEPGQEERAAQIQHENNIESMCKNYTDMIGHVDAVMLVTRNGADHFEQAKPFMEEHIPIWVDKPVALNSADTAKLCEYANKCAAPLMGGSTLKHCSDVREVERLIKDFEKVDYFSFSYCSSVGSPNGGVSFYSSHVAEIVYHLFGDNIASVTASQYNKTVVVTLLFKNGMVASLPMVEYGYTCTYSIIGADKAKAAAIECADCYEQELHYMYDVLSGKAAPLSAPQFISPVKIMEAIERALENEGEKVLY